MKKIGLLISVLTLVLFSCIKEEEITCQSDFDKKAMLANYSNSLIIPRYETLEKNLTSLYTKINVFISSNSLSDFNALNASFDSTYLSWQGVSYFQFGPAETYVIKSVFNIFPVDTTKINNNISSGSYILGSASNTDAIGLPALDYLLHKGSSETLSFNYFTGTNSANKKQYLLDLVNQLSSTLSSVLNQWNTSYKSIFNNSDGTSQGSSLSNIVNALNLDFEKFIRDGKVGVPLGVRSLGTPLPEKSEAYFGGKSTELCKESILKLKSYFKGGSGQGLDDYLIQLDAKYGSQLLATKINNQFDLIISKIKALSSPIAEEVIANQANVQDLYDEMQRMVVLLKVDLSSALSILITYQDNDGD